jgi:prepilin-type N-terminal cleavage/methylation domain-containing protein
VRPRSDDNVTRCGSPNMFTARPRRGFSLIELIIAVGITAVLLGLLLAAVQNARRAAQRAHCQNNLRQIGLACHSYHDVHNMLPPGIGYYPELPASVLQQRQMPFGTWLVHMLPYFGRGDLYQLSYHWDNPDLYSQRIKLFECPGDPTSGETVTDNLGRTFAGGSYVGNVQVFCNVRGDGTLADVEGKPVLLASFPDGASCTILATEKYTRCTNNTYAIGGTGWAYSQTAPTAVPLHSGFAISWNGESTGPASIFQDRPRPDDCDPTRASTGHVGGIEICLADGSVRLLSTSVSQYVWWALCTPAGGEVLGSDW